MSMNFAREQSLLRQRLQAAGSPAAGAARQQELATATTCLGAPADAVEAAAADLVALHPQMGRAQMTAFVRTLWASRIHELRTVGAAVLAARATLLEPADLPFLEQLLRDTDAEPLLERLADQVLGALLARHKKLWKDLKRLLAAASEPQRRALVRACRLPVLADGETFARFAELVEPLLGTADPRLQTAIDEVLAATAVQVDTAAREFAARHGRVHVVWPPPAPRAPVLPPAPAAPVAVPQVAPPAPAPKPKAPVAKPAAAKPKAPKAKAAAAGKLRTAVAPAPKVAAKKAAAKKPAPKRAGKR
jgi:3-methyladenine DNA glycosylase AlkD